jgi:hypothetical protein
MRSNPPKSAGDLLRVCHLIYREALPVLSTKRKLSMNAFYTDNLDIDRSSNPADPSASIELRFPDLDHMRTITICMEDDVDSDPMSCLATIATVLKLLKNCARVTRLILDIDIELDISAEDLVEVFKAVSCRPDVEIVLSDYENMLREESLETYYPLTELLRANV